MKIVFFGTSEFGAIILEKLVRAGLSPVLVVTTPDKPVGRKQILTPPPVKVFATTHGLEVFQPEKFNETTNYKLKTINSELFVVAAYGKILPKEVLDIPTHGTLNVHPSLLPKYRGSSPVQNTILNGDKETGVTVILLDEKMDHGPIIANSKFKIQNSKFTYPELHNALAELGAELLVNAIPQWVERNIKGVPQDDSKATYTAIFKKEDGRIDWNKEALYIERQVRALQPWPGTFTACEIDGKRKMLKILKASVLPQEKPLGKPGQAFSPPLPGIARYSIAPGIAVQTGSGALLLEELQLEGGKPMSSKEFLLGHKNILSTILC